MNGDDLAALVAEHASMHSVPGAALGILSGGETTATWHGVADATTRESVTPETTFSVGSLTKSMVATAIVRLADTGQLSLDDPVAAHVPELSRSGWAHRATVRDLLANRSGLPLRAATEFGFARHRDEDDGALSRLVAEAAEEGSAVDFWSYSNLGWCLLGRVIEAVSGTTWEDAMRRLLFHPTGMSSTTFAIGSDTKQRVSGHEIKAGNPVPVEPLVARAYGPAGTSVVSTVSDLLRFAALHLDDPSFVALRAAQDAVSIYGWFDAWCLGWARFDWQGGPVWGWDGLISGERSVLRIVPQHQAAIVLLTNSSSGRAMYRSLLADLMRPLFGIEVPPAEPGPVVACARGPLGLCRDVRVAGSEDRGVGHATRPCHQGGSDRNRGAAARRAGVPRRPRRSRHSDSDVRGFRCEWPPPGALRHAVGAPARTRMIVRLSLDLTPSSARLMHHALALVSQARRLHGRPGRFALRLVLCRI